MQPAARLLAARLHRTSFSRPLAHRLPLINTAGNTEIVNAPVADYEALTRTSSSVSVRPSVGGRAIAMGRHQNAVVRDFFLRGQKLDDSSNRYHHDCKKCGEHVSCMAHRCLQKTRSWSGVDAQRSLRRVGSKAWSITW